MVLMLDCCRSTQRYYPSDGALKSQRTAFCMDINLATNREYFEFMRASSFRCMMGS